MPQIVTNYLTPSDKDEKINTAIMAAYEQAAQTGVFAALAERRGWAEGASLIWDVETNLWEGKLTVAFSDLPYERIDQQSSAVVSMVTLDLATGEVVDTDYLRNELPENWETSFWAYRFNNEYGYAEYDSEYVLPENSELRYFRKTYYNTLVFNACQPDGEIVTINVQLH
ncbi:MAG: hypothetical protein LBI54_05815 [Lachnospiraceae bacterium]|nr:hypothetical protein [Lachnospiraceae bacterium]